MSKHTVDVNFINKGIAGGIAGKSGRANINDSTSIKNLSNALKTVLENNSKKSGANIEKALKQLLKDVVKSSNTSSIKQSDINKLVKGISQELGREVVKSIVKNLPKTSTSNQKDLRSLDNSITKASNNVAKIITDKLNNKLDVKINTKDLANSISDIVRSSIPKSTETATKDLVKAVSSIKDVVREISNVSKSIQSMRQSGGKVDVSEIGKVLSSIKKIGTDFTNLSLDAKKAKDSLNDIAKESETLVKSFSNTVDNIQKSTKNIVSNVQKNATNDPKAFTKELVSTLTDAIKKSDSLKNTKLVDTISKFEGKIGDIDKLTKEFNKFQTNLKREITSGKVKIEGIESLLKDLDKVTTAIGSIPKNIGSDKINKEWESVVISLNKFIQKSSKLTTQVKLIVDDKELRKAIPSKVELPVKLSPEVQSLYNKVKTTVETSLKEAGSKGLYVKPIIEDIAINLSKNDFGKVRSALHDLMSLDIDIDITKLANELRKQISVIESGVSLDIHTTKVKDKLAGVSKSYDVIIDKQAKLNDSLTTLNRAKSAGLKIDPTAFPLYKEKTVIPNKLGDVESSIGIKKLSSEAKDIKMATEENIKNLSASLYKLQSKIVNTLDSQFEAAGKKWAVVKPEGIKDPTKVFNLTPGGKQWKMEIVNLNKLQRTMQDFDSSVSNLITNFKKQYIQESVNTFNTPTQMADLIGRWLKSVNTKQIKSTSGIDAVTQQKLINIKESNVGVEVGEEMRKAIQQSFGEGSKLINIFKKTYGETSASKKLRSEGLLKSIALPAASTTATGDVSFQTTHGSKRSLPKFVKFETGFEVLYKELENLKQFDKARSFQNDIKSIGIRPLPSQKQMVEEVAENLIAAVASSLGDKNKAKDYVKSIYSGAVTGKGFELEKSGDINAEDYKNKINTAIKSFETLSDEKQTFKDFVKTMRTLNLTAYDVVKSLSKIEVQNVYDLIGNVIEGDKKTSPLGTIAKQPNYSRSIRNFEGAIGEIEGLLPLLKTNRPRRGFQQENIVNLLTRTSNLYDRDRLSPDEQKKLIKDLNLELSDVIDRLKAQGPGKLPLGLNKLSSLGIPESQAGNVEEYRIQGGTGGLKYLKTLNATSVKLYADDLTSLAPFQQFQQAGRNISNISNAMIDLAGKVETPKLRSEREKALIESGRYGQKGYGYNVVAELRNTAANFEDQILISGKLANAMTSAVKTLVKPGPSGRIANATAEERIAGTGVTEIKEGEITKVAKEYMKILGVSETYKGRADKALIEDVKKTIAVVRGEDVEVQQAKLAETFLNYFGRKLTTRYGSKGVSVTPTGQPENLADILQKQAGKKIKVDPSATLGYQVAPKSIGELASELFGKDISKELKDRLITSGNKFMIDLFQDVNIVSKSEAEKTKKLYMDFSDAWNKVFGTKPELGTKGIQAIRSKHEATFGEKAGLNLRPIDVRISSYGAAKRGLQTEFMESIFSNVAGTGKGGVTTLKQLKQPEYEKLLSGGMLSKYSKALGYKGATKSEKEIGTELFKTFGGKGTFEEALSSGDDKAILAKRAAALEAASNYYSTVIDEFGKERKGLVGEKFLQIVEEPIENPEWEKSQIEKGAKGAKLNVPAYSAYSTIFGEQSSIMGELKESLNNSFKKHWEYLKALQTLHDKDSEIYQNITEGLKNIDISELRSFDLSTGVYGKKYTTNEKGEQIVNPRSFADTILDIEKYPEAFNLNIPTGEYSKEGKVKKESFFVPSAAARGTFEDPLLAGERGMDQVTRRLSHVVSMAKQLEEAMKDPSSFIDFQDIEQAIKPAIGNLVKEAMTLSNKNTPEAEQRLVEIMSKLAKGLSTTVAPSPALIKTHGKSEYDYASDFYKRQMEKVETGQKSKGKAYATTIGTMSDLLIGKKTGTPTQLAAPTALSRAMGTGQLEGFTKSMGIDTSQIVIDKKVKALQKAKIDYYNTLAETAMGKGGSVNELLFNRKIPAIMGKAVTAVVDKRSNIDKFGKTLQNIESKYGLNLSEQIESLSGVAKQHGEAIKGYEKIGVPVLRQEELGVPETFASKIPLEFIKKFKVDKTKGIMTQKPETVKGSLATLLKFVEKLQEASLEEGPARKEQIEDYINEELVPYIESVRFPFTGSSSITPFKPKLIKEGSYADKSGRALEKNALIVPGIPEGLGGLAPIIDKLKSDIESAMTKREQLQTIEGPQEEIDRLTSLIKELNMAISEVIPKYTSQAQKLDFDGDNIEIHAAKTAAARKDIETHFKRFHETAPNKDVRTQDIFMQRFLSDAADVKTTGPHVFGESMAAFEKKFPMGKGFEFMKSPFLTKDLEYMSSREALGVLSGNKNIGDVSNVLEDVLTDMGKSGTEISDMLNKINNIPKEDPKMYIDGIMSMFESSYSDILKRVESGIKKRLYEEKMGDTVEAQLFKVHTGPETEAMYRVHRLAEANVSFGGGQIGGPGKSSDYFKKRFPKIKAFGENPEEEFHTMINEFLRFGIQKGMDVKHAGEKPVAGKMLGYLSKGLKGANDLWNNIQDTEDKTFSDLRDFSKDTEKAIRMRLGELPTTEIADEAKKLISARGGDVEDIDNSSREELIKLIVDKVGFKGFLEEMSLLIKKEAIDGLVAQAKNWTPAKKSKPGAGLAPIKGLDIQSWAESEIGKQISGEGINIRSAITEAQNPLYTKRTFGASPSTEYEKYKSQYGDITTPGTEVSKLSDKELESYSFKYKKAKATALGLQRELSSFSSSKSMGAYSEMVKGTIDTLNKQQTEIDGYISTLIKENYDPSLYKQVKLSERVLSRKGVTSFSNSILNMKEGMSEEVSRLSDLVGIHGLSDYELFNIEKETSKKFASLKQSELKESGMSKEEVNKEVEVYVDRMVAKAQALKQLDRVTDVLMSKKNEGKYLRNIFDGSVKPVQTKSFNLEQRDIFKEVQSKLKQEQERRTITEPSVMYRGGEGQSGASIKIESSGSPIPVYVTGMDSSIVVKVSLLEDLGIISKDIRSNLNNIDLSSILEKTISKIRPTFAEPVSTEKYFSPSRLAGGGDVYSFGKKKPAFTEDQRMQEQLVRLVESMTTEKTMSESGKNIVDWGTLLHAKIQKAFEKRNDVDIEKYKQIEDTVGGVIGGSADLIEYTSPDKEKISKIIDIKSATEPKINKIRKAVEKAGTTDISEVSKYLDDNVKRQLNDYFSQLNTYLKIFDETATAQIRFYDKEKLGADVTDYQALDINFDPERYKKDMEQLAKAREIVKTSGTPFTSIQNRPINEPSPEDLPSSEELTKAMEAARDLFKSKKGMGATKLYRKDDDTDAMNRINSMIDQIKNISSKPKYDKLSSDDLDRFLVPPPIATGQDTKAFFTNLSTLHDQAKIYQKIKGVDMEAIGKMPKQIGDAIESVATEGPDYQSFIDLTNKLKEMERPDFSGKDIVTAWKVYRLAIGDYFVKQAKEAEDKIKELEDAGDIREANQAYGTYQKNINRLQEFIRRGIGKPTDIYTEDKRFVYPGLAKAAGVYMSPEQIVKKVGEPLGDDEQLIDAFKNITSGLNKSDLKAPVESARDTFRDLSDMNRDLIAILSNGEKMSRMGTSIIEAWDFDKLTARATRLREALQNVLKQSGELNAEQKQNINNIVKYLKNIETLYANVNLKDTGGYGQTGIVSVPKFETPEIQSALHSRNIQSVRSYFEKSEESGGPKIGEGFSYQEKIIGAAGETIKNVTHHFKKYGEEVLASGEKVGMFSESQNDLIEKMNRSNATFSNAIRRVVLWGSASRLVYGGVSYLTKSLDELSNVEVGLAKLRMVMNPLETDFNRMAKSATGLAKQYGVPTTDILNSMKVFAQQGLKQEEVIDRAETATLASNVSTLNAKDATEALTSAMKVFREEGNQSLRFLDAWSEVESKHAITAEDMANAIKKSASAAKTAGLTFDQLNGIVAAVGSVTRQSGKEIGTSFRFILRRLFSEEGPKALAKLPNPITTLTDSGDLKSGFKVLSELSTQWKDLTNAQKLNIAQSIGGTRQYNALLVLMNQWDEALRGIRNSTNSKGSAERRNLEIMKTYSKQLEQTKAAATELKMEVGSIVLPTFKVGLKGLKLLIETITNIPASVKFATTGLLLMFGAFAKGVPMIDSFIETISKGKAIFNDFGSSLSKQLDISKFEITGKGKGDIFGLKTLTAGAAKVANTQRGMDGIFGKQGDATSTLIQQGEKLSDFHSSLGKILFITKEVGQGYNDIIGSMINKTGELTQSAGKTAKDLGSFLSFSGAAVAGGSLLSPKNLISTLQGAATQRGLGVKDVKSAFKGGPKSLSKLGGKALGLAGEVAGLASTLVGQVLDKSGEYVGKGGQSFLKNFTSQNTGLIKSIAPLSLTVAALAPGLKAAYNEFEKMASSAKDFEKSMANVKRKNEDQLKSVRDLMQGYDVLADRVNDINKASDPTTKKRRMELGTYESPLVGMQKIQNDVIDLSNNLAQSNTNLIVGYDNLGNAVLKSTGNFKYYLKEIEKLNTLQGAETEVKILDRFITDLTETEGPEKFKATIKDLAESFPVIGDLISRNIKIGPAKALELASNDLNKRLNLKQKYPLSTAAETDIKRLQEVLAKARDSFKDTFSDFNRIYEGVVSPTNLKGLSPEKIQDLLTSETLKKAYELKLKIEPKFKLAEGVKAEDIMGKDLLTALNPKLSGILGESSNFTKANVETLGISDRLKSKAVGAFTKRQGKVYSGDIATIRKDLSDVWIEAGENFEIAGDQVIVKLKETSDGVFEWMAQYFNTKTLKVEERAFSDLEPFVEGILPTQKIKEELSYRMESLNTFVAGAAAGLVGITEKSFKKDFNLGERFFSEIPTTTLLQGDFGYAPNKGYGKIPQAENFGKDIREYYFKPMDELKTKMEQIDKLRLEGIESGDVDLSKGMYESINELLTILKNNQVVLQFKAVFADLMKEFSEGERVLKQNINILKRRMEVEKETSGLMVGVSKNIGDYNLGITKVSELSPRQQLLRSSGSSRDLAQNLRVLTATSEGQLTQLDSIEKALVNLSEIKDVAKATGVALDKSKLGDYIETVAKSTDDEGPFKELSNINMKVEENTSATVERLDSLLENQGDPKTIEKLISSFSDNLGTGVFNSEPKKIVNALERVAEVRKKAESTDNQEAVIAANTTIDKLSKKLINEVGFDEGYRLIDKTFQGFRKDFKADEFRQRAFGALNPEMFLKKMEEYGKIDNSDLVSWQKSLGFGRSNFIDSKELKDIRKLQEDDGKQSLITGKTIAKVQAAIAAASYFEKRGNNAIVNKLDDQVKQLDTQIVQAKAEGVSTAKLNTLTKKRDIIVNERDEKQKSADFYGTVASLGAAGVAANELAMSLGLTEGQVKALNVAAIGTYGAMKIASKTIGKEMPESAKAFGEDLKGVAKKVISGEKPGKLELMSLSKSGKQLIKETSENTKKMFGKSSEELVKDIKKTTKSQESKQIAEGEKTVRGIEATTGTNRVAQALATYLATATTDYVSRKRSERSGLATTEKRMAEQQEMFIKAIEKYPEAAGRVLDDLYKAQTETEKLGQTSDVATVTKSLVQDTDSEYKKVVSMIDDYNKEIVAAHERAAKEIAKIQLELADREVRTADNQLAYRAIVEEKNRRAINEINKKYSLKNIIQSGLGGYGGDFDLPVTKTELSTQQRLYSESGPKFKATINAYSDGIMKLDTMRKRIEAINSRMSEEAEIAGDVGFFEGIFNNTAAAKAEDRYDALSDALEKQIEITDKYAEKLKDFSNSYMYLEKFSSAMYELQNSLRDVGIQEAVDRIPGLQTLRKELDKLLGGSHPEAIQAITPEEERIGSRVGINLRMLRSNKYDVEEAKLRDQLRTATGQQAVDIRQRLTDLPEQRRRDLMVREQQRQDEGLKRALTPFENQLTSLERIKVLPNISEGLNTQISDYQMEIGNVLSKATERMSVADYTKELEANRGNISKDAYEVEKSRLSEIEKAGLNNVYRGVTPWDKSNIVGKIPEEIRDAMKQATIASGEGLTLEANVADPIVAKLDETNSILKAISEEQFGMSFDKPGVFDKIKNLFTGKEYFNLNDYAVKKASGGSIVGPGGPKEDKIPAWLSNGEYVIKASSVKQLGTGTLDYINQKGSLPGFAEGGEVKEKSLLFKLFDFLGMDFKTTDKEIEAGSYLEPGDKHKARYDAILDDPYARSKKRKKFSEGGFAWDRIFRTGSEGSEAIIDMMKKKRLALAEQTPDMSVMDSAFSFLKQGALAAGEIGGSLLKLPVDALAKIEGASDYFTNTSFKGIKKDVKSVGKKASAIFSSLENMSNEEFIGLTKNIGSGILGSLGEEVKSGGTGITSGIIESLIPVGLLNGKSGNITKELGKNINLPSVKDIEEFVTASIDVAKAPSNKKSSYSVSKVSDYINSLSEKNPKLKGINFELPESIDSNTQAKTIKKIIDDANEYSQISELSRGVKTIDLGQNARKRLTIADESSDKIKGKALGVYNAQKESAAFDINQGKALVGNTFSHEIKGHAFDTESTIFRNFLSTLDESKLPVSAKRFIKERNDIDELVKQRLNTNDRSLFPSLYAFKSKDKGAFTARREFFAESIGKLSKENIDKEIGQKISNFIDLTGKDKNINKMIELIAKTDKYKQFRKTSLADMKFADGGEVKEKPLLFKLFDFLGLPFKNDDKKIEVGSYLEPGDKHKKRYDEILDDPYARSKKKKFAAGGKVEDDKWALSTLKDVNKTILEDRRGTELNKEKFMGISGQYDTPIYREAIEGKKESKLLMDARREGIAFAKSSGRRTQAREAGLANIMGGVKPDYGVMGLDARRQLVRLDDDPVAYQSKYNLRSLNVDGSYDPKSNLANSSYQTTLRGKSTPLNTKKGGKYYLDVLQNNYNKAEKAYKNINTLKDVSDEDKKLIKMHYDRAKEVLDEFNSGSVKPLDSAFQKKVLLAMQGGTTQKNKPMGLSSATIFNDKNPSFAGLAELINRKAIFAEYDKLTGMENSIGLFRKDPSAFIDALNTKSRVTPGIIQPPTETIIDKYTPGTADEIAKLLDKAKGFTPEQKEVDFFNSMVNRSANVFHNGGVITQTGKIFAKKGEVIVPEKFASGGEVNYDLNTASMKSGAISLTIDTEEIIKKLEDIELKVEDKELKVEDKELKIEDKKFTVEDKEFKVIADNLEVKKPDWKVEVDSTNIPKIAVEKPDWQIGVNVPTEKISVDIDVTDAAARLNDAITAALNKTVKVEVSGSNNVGADKFNQLAKTVSDVNDKIINVKSELDGKIKLLGSNNETSDIDRRVSTIVDTKIISIQQSLNTLRNDVGDVSSTQRQKDTYYQSKFDDLDYRLRNSMNITGIGTGGILI